MADNIKNKTLNQAIRDIMNDLRNGMDSREAFLRQTTAFDFTPRFSWVSRQKAAM